jgi:hypothetical protein
MLKVVGKTICSARIISQSICYGKYFVLKKEYYFRMNLSLSSNICKQHHLFKRLCAVLFRKPYKKAGRK